MVHLNSLAFLFQGRLVDPRLRVSNEGFMDRALHEHRETMQPASRFLPLLGELADCPSLRASDEHSFIVRVLRARRTVWLLPSSLKRQRRGVRYPRFAVHLTPALRLTLLP